MSTATATGIHHRSYAAELRLRHTKAEYFRLALMVALLLLAPSILDNYWLSIANTILIAVIGAVGLNILVGFTGQISISKLNGPVSIGRASVTAAKQGLDSVLYLIAILSVNLAVFNLLPIPILDGGQIAVNLVEAVKGGSLSTRTREYLLRFGLAAIALLFVIVLYNDIASLVRSLLGL